MADAAAVSAMVERDRGGARRRDDLVNNAATSVASNVSWLEITPEEWDRVQAANLHGSFLCARAVYAGDGAAGGGSIVNVSSVRVLARLARESALHGEQGGLIGLTRTLAREVGPDGIRVNCLVVGAIRTPEEALYGDAGRGSTRCCSTCRASRCAACPRTSPRRLVPRLVRLGRFVTGQCLTVDGGWVMT